MVPPVTLQQIADKAGVSRMTVSRALRNSPKVTKATAARIQALAISLGYKPDPLIQRLTSHLAQIHRRSDGQVIAWINPWNESVPWRGQMPFYSMYLGAAARAQKLGFRLEEFRLRQPGMTGKKLSRILYQRGIECLILAPIPKGGGHLTMDWDKFSAVAIGYSMIFPRMHRVGSHHQHAAREAIRQLYRRGYRRIGLLLTRDVNARHNNSWLEAMAYYHFRSPKKNRVKPLIQAEFSIKGIPRWLKEERPDSILTHDRRIREILTRAGYRNPEDIGLVFSDLDCAESTMAGIDQRYDLIGETATDMVIGQHHRNEKGVPPFPHTVMIEGHWVDGNIPRRRGSENPA